MFELLLSVVFIGILAIEAERVRKRRREIWWDVVWIKGRWRGLFFLWI